MRSPRRTLLLRAGSDHDCLQYNTLGISSPGGPWCSLIVIKSIGFASRSSHRGSRGPVAGEKNEERDVKGRRKVHH